MKIICIDNYNRESISDILVAENVSEYYAFKITSCLNKNEGNKSPYFYKAVKDNYKLYNAMELY